MNPRDVVRPRPLDSVVLATGAISVVDKVVGWLWPPGYATPACWYALLPSGREIRIVPDSSLGPHIWREERRG